VTLGVEELWWSESKSHRKAPYVHDLEKKSMACAPRGSGQQGSELLEGRWSEGKPLAKRLHTIVYAP